MPEQDRWKLELSEYIRPGRAGARREKRRLADSHIQHHSSRHPLGGGAPALGNAYLLEGQKHHPLRRGETAMALFRPRGFGIPLTGAFRNTTDYSTEQEDFPCGI